MRTLAAGIGLTALAIGPASARSPFDGVWVADLDTQSGLGIDRYLIRDGQYRCLSCQPPRRYAADGKPHRIEGDPDVLTEAVTIAGPRTIITHLVGPPLDRTTTMTVALDGRSATYVSLDRRPGLVTRLRTVYLARRIAAAPAGAHPVSGSWQGVRYSEVPALVRTTRLRLDGNRFSYATPLGVSFVAILGGVAVPVHARRNENVRVAVRRLSPRTIEERAMREGRLIVIRTFTVSPAGHSLTIATADPERGTTFKAISRRTPQ